MDVAHKLLALAASSIFLWTVWRANQSSKSDGFVVKIVLFVFSVTSFAFLLLAITATEETTQIFGLWLLTTMLITLSVWLWWGAYRYAHLVSKLHSMRKERQ